MPASPFEAKVRREPGVTIVDLSGEVNAFARERLETAYAEAVAEDPSKILLNFEEVTYINSTGIALVVGLLAKARASHRQVLACGLSDHYREIFTITRLADFMTIYPDERSAVAGAPAPAV